MTHHALRIGVALAAALLVGAAGASAQVLINEVDCDTPGLDNKEFIELIGPAGHSLDGYVLVLYNGYLNSAYQTWDLDGYSIGGNGYFLVGNQGVSPAADIVFADNLLQNGADAVALYLGDGTDFPWGEPVKTENLVDAFVYDTNDPDDPGIMILLEAGQVQVNEDELGDAVNHSSQRCPDGEGGARVTTHFYQGIPTPGASNSSVCGFTSTETTSWGEIKALFR
ncbi:MAG: hypothetical protein ABIK65_12235 [Candidatus Eisenbacteria bacterium]